MFDHECRKTATLTTLWLIKLHQPSVRFQRMRAYVRSSCVILRTSQFIAIFTNMMEFIAMQPQRSCGKESIPNWNERIIPKIEYYNAALLFWQRSITWHKIHAASIHKVLVSAGYVPQGKPIPDNHDWLRVVNIQVSSKYTCNSLMTLHAHGLRALAISFFGG